MGDPEGEVVIPRIKSDLLNSSLAWLENNLEEKTLETDNRFAACVMLVSGGYPGSYAKGKVISGLDNVKDSIIFHAGTDFQTTNNELRTPNSELRTNIVTNGGRVIAITSFGNTIQEALALSYKNAEIIQFEGKYYRHDIGEDLI